MIKKTILSTLFGLTTLLLFAQERSVVILSMDGFRNEYLERANTPLFDSLMRVGSYATTYPCFPSNTFPNHYSMATGLHPDHHGIVNNSFYDRETKQTFTIKDRKAILNPKNWLGEPIWNTAEKQGVRSFVFHWVGSEVSINGMTPSKYKAYNHADWYEKADSVLKWMSLPEKERPRLIMWYLPEPDAIGHSESPDSKKTIDKIENIDKMLSYFMSRAKQCEAYEHTNFIFVSDHGMTTAHSQISISNYLKGIKMDKIFIGTPTFIYANKKNQQNIMKRLKNVKYIKAYLIDSLPKTYHYGTMKSREADIVVMPDPGYIISDNEFVGKVGAHGYDPFIEDMKSPFFAVGPDFKVGYKGESFQNLNLYVLLSYLLGIDPAINDGDIKNVENLFYRDNK